MDPGLRRDDALKDEQPSRRPILKLQTRHIRKVILIVGDDHGVETQRMCCQQAVEARTPERKPRIGASSRLIERQHRNHREKGVENLRSEEHTSEPQSLMRISYAVFCLKKKTTHTHYKPTRQHIKKT